MTDEHRYRTFVHSDGSRRVMDYYGACECGAHSLPMVFREDAEQWTCPRADAEAEVQMTHDVRSKIAAVTNPRPFWHRPLDVERIKRGGL